MPPPDIFEKLSRSDIESRTRNPLNVADYFKGGAEPTLCQLPNIFEVGKNQTWLSIQCTLTWRGGREPASGAVRYDANSNGLYGSLARWHPEPGHEPFGGSFKYYGIGIWPDGGAFVSDPEGSVIWLSYLCIGRSLFALDDDGTEYVIDLNIYNINSTPV